MDAGDYIMIRWLFEMDYEERIFTNEDVYDWLVHYENVQRVGHVVVEDRGVFVTCIQDGIPHIDQWTLDGWAELVDAYMEDVEEREDLAAEWQPYMFL